MKSFNKLKNVFWCKNCVSMSTRPRISFDYRGFCSACVWTEEKKNLNWRTREKVLDKLLSNHRSKKKSKI